MLILETERLLLREMVETDFACLCKILCDNEVMYAYEGAFSEEEAKKWLSWQFENYKTYGFGLWAVVLRETGEMIGQCGLTYQNYNEKKVLEVGYLFQKAFWHQGFATEAAKACRDFAFDKLNENEVFSIIRDTNTASQNVALRNGMSQVGSFIKHYRGVDMPHLLFSIKK